MKTSFQRKIIDIFNINENRRSPKGWYESDCLFCGKESHLGINLGELSEGKYKNKISFKCLKCKEHGGAFKLLKKVGREDLLEGYIDIDITQPLENKLFEFEKKVTEEDGFVPTRYAPLGWKRVMSDKYLEERGFESWQFELYHIGKTNLIKGFKDYVIFLILENGENKGFIARSTKTKKWIDNYNKDVKKWNRTHEKKYHKNKYLRYQNEGGVDFDKLLFGYDEITAITDTVIVVEGITDKANVDKLLRLDKSKTTKCVCSFGKELSEHQQKKLIGKSIKRVILMYDPDAIDDSKRYSNEISSAFEEVKVGFLKEKDPGDLNKKELLNILENLEDPLNFSIGKVLNKL